MPALRRLPDKKALRLCGVQRIGVYGACITRWIAGVIAIPVSTMAARHRERYCASARQLSTITPEFCPRSNRIAVHDDLESLSSMSRNSHLDVNYRQIESKKGNPHNHELIELR